jgi:hypothetical protein
MSHIFLAYSSSKECLEKLDLHINKSNSSNALGNVYDIIPFNLASQVNFLTSSYKFKECKEYVKKSINLENYKEVLYDGNINDLNTIYTDNDEAYWVLRVPVNRLISSYLPSKVNHQNKKETFMIFVKDEEKDVLIGVADSRVQIFKLIEETTNVSVSKREITGDVCEIVCANNTFVIKKMH